MTLNSTRRSLLVGAAATLALPAYIRRVNAQTVVKVAGVHASPVENAWNSRIHLAFQQAAAAPSGTVIEPDDVTPVPVGP